MIESILINHNDYAATAVPIHNKVCLVQNTACAIVNTGL